MHEVLSPLRSAGSVGICAAIGATSMLAALVGTPSSAVAQEWWEQIPGFGSPSYSNRRERVQPAVRRTQEQQADKFEDLRPNATPWLSDVMLASMDKAIERYERIVQRGGWKMIPKGRTIRPGDDDDRIPVIKARLRATGDLAPSHSYFESLGLDDSVEQALRSYQRRNGLRITGRVDRATLTMLNVPAKNRLDQLILNRQRIVDLMRPHVENRYVLVNVPAFQLEAVESYEVKQRHRVIVGREGRETPELRGQIRALNFFPYWRVPTSVATLDLIPRVQREPQYLNEEGIRIYDGSYDGPEIPQSQINWNSADTTRIRFKQDPGDKNALGLVRLDMSNEHGVYMHDTPMKNLFGQAGRAFSAGCVRVQGVFDLAEWIAQYEPGWEQPGKVRSILDGGQPVDLTLTRPVPVIFAYITAWAEPNGEVNFRHDLYNRDGSATLAARDTSEPDPDQPPPPSGGITP
ncbi:MAG TPA: L,D-transpeptidase family protein [Hyphomicrobiaceae bacterium]|nr:L,D-transpeptidase family protein [Hyphomicrobiaceae bacterium]